MKNTLIIILLVVCSLFYNTAYSQTTYNPDVASSNNNNVIQQITITDSETIVYLKCPRSGWISFSSATVMVPYEAWSLNDLRRSDLSYPDRLPSAEYAQIYASTIKKVKEGRQTMSNLGFLIRGLGNNKLDVRYKVNQKDVDYYYFQLHFDKLEVGVENVTIRELIGANGFEWAGVKVNNPYPSTPHISSTDDSIMRSIDSNNDGITGIYEGFDSQGYKLACVVDNNTYKLVYMGSKEKYSHWKMGDVKAILLRSATHGFFKAQWYMNNKTINDDTYVMFKGGSLEVVIDGETSGYLKMYPTTSPSSPSGINSWTGTGFAINDGYIVTNHHIVEGAKQILVQGIEEDFSIKYRAKVVASDKNNDIALIKIDDPKFCGFGHIPYKIKSSLSDVGEDIFVLGYPLTATMGDEVKLTTGVISSKTGFEGDVALYQISAPIQPGNSGGPLFDSSGDIIGIVNAKHVDADNVGYAVKSSYLSNFIESVATTSIIPSSNSIASKTLPEKIKVVDNFVFLLECSNGD